jgi:proline iminopeptidase
VAGQDTVDRFLFRDPADAKVVRDLWQVSGTRNAGVMAAVLAARPPRLQSRLWVWSRL